ncbi:unnamed protein product, partial [Hapterophycus canaliculatus]
MKPEPCRLFVWNVASAGKFCECSRLVESAAKKTLWKDSHGQLWLRMPSSSPLLRLFPCQQHSLSRCVKCGHDYRAHVENTLRRRRDRPYDRAVRRKAGRNGGGAAGIQDFRGAAVFSDKRKARRDPSASEIFAGLRSWGGNGNGNGSGNASARGCAPAPDGVAAAAGSATTVTGGPPAAGRRSRSSSSVGGGGSSNGSGRGGDFSSAGWRRRLAVLAEAQRAALMQTAGVLVTSTEAREAYKVEHDRRLRSEAAKAEAERKKGRRGVSRGGGGGGGGGGRGGARARK